MPRMTITLMLMLLINLITMSGYAATKAGTRIINQAEATYFDTGAGQIITVKSNYATFYVATKLAVEQDREQEIKAGAGQLVYFPHTVINTGNKPDNYELTVANASNDNGDLLDLAIYIDENGDGLVNFGEQRITSTEQLQPGQQIQIVVVGKVPDTSSVGDQYSVTMTTASKSDPTVNDSDKNVVTTSDDAIIRINRTTDTDCAIALDLGDRSQHTVDFANIGKKAPEERHIVVDGVRLRGVLIEEAIPDHMTLLKNPAFFSLPTEGMLLVGTPLGEWLSYAQWNAQSTVINKLAVLMPADKMKPNQSGRFGYTYQVTSLPTQETRLEIQTTIDGNSDGNPDFLSNFSCNTLQQDSKIIKDRPSLVLHGTVFDAGELYGVSGATVTLISTANGSSNRTPVATTVSANSGRYEFTDIVAGEYYIETTPPTGYELSRHAPSYFSNRNVIDASYGIGGYAPANSDSKSGVFSLDPAKDASLIDIPLDREGIRGQIAISKDASTEGASIGEPVAYTVVIQNLTSQDLYTTYIEDLLPAGFKYLKGTVKLNGAFTADPTQTHDTQTGRSKLTFRIGDFLEEGKHELTYIAQVTAQATHSDGVNTAFAYADTITNLLVKSPTASAKVTVSLDGVTSDRAILFGRVAVAKGCAISKDTKLNDGGFPLAGVRLYMEDGTYVVTDPNGQYSLYGLQPGIHVLKVDNHSLPEGVQMTLTSSQQAGDPDSRFVDLTPGDFHRADFTAACPEATRPQIVTQCVEPPPPPLPVQPMVKKPQPIVKKPTPVVPAPKPTPPPVRKVRQCVDKPVSKQVTRMVTRTIKDVIQPVYFDSGKAEIPPKYAAKLQQLMHMARDKKNVRFRMAGHTDNQRLKTTTKRQFGDNKGLSEARASQVAQHVLSKLGSTISISIAGFGDTRPVASNASPAGMAKNRRVELVMQYDEPEVTIQRSSKQVCSIKTVAATNTLVQAATASAQGAKGAKGSTKTVAGLQAFGENGRVITNKPLTPMTIQPAADNNASAKALAGLAQQSQGTKSAAVQSVSQDGKKLCKTTTIAGTNPVIENILARSKHHEFGWQTEVDTLDLANADNLKNVAQMAGTDGDISSGLIEAHDQKIKQQQHDFAREQKAEHAAAGKAAEESMPDSKIAVKTVTNEQGKAGIWLWPKGDISLDGRFMVIVRSGVTPTLLVNGEPVSDRHLGEQIENRSAKAQVMAWYGVELKEGENTIKVTAKGPFGNDRVLAEKQVKRPSAGVAIKMSTENTLVADGGRSTVPVNIEILDRNGYPAKGTYFLTLENSDGRWAEPDIQDKVAGHQVKVTNGQRTVHLRSSAKSGKIKLRASTGKLQSETDVSQIAELRPLIAVGLLDLRAHKGYRNGYENLGLIQLENGDEDEFEISGRAALFMKGEIRNNMHLTLSYDSEKDKDAELLRDIDPAEYYRVYGDSSKRGYEGQSRSPLYLKLEKERHSIMWGDYLTDNTVRGADIATTQRTLTGLNGIYDDGRTRLQLFAAEQDNQRGFEEIPGNGTAMQYQLQHAPIVKNSEVIEVVTRDRNNSGLIISTAKMQRFSDYSIDDYTGFLTFHRVIPSVDENLNPVSLRISYDRIEEGESYLVAGVRMLHQLNDAIKLGASYTQDDHSTEGFKMAGVHGEYKDELNELEIGVARMLNTSSNESGDAIRIKASREWVPGSRTELTATQADAAYTNNSSGVIANRREVKLTQRQRFGKNIEGKLALSHSESLSSDELRQTAELSATTRLGKWKFKGGARHIRQNVDDSTAQERINTALVGVERDLEIFGRRGSIRAEYEREIGQEQRQRISVGADMQVTDKAKAYIRYEQADRLSAGTLAGSVETSKSLVAGVKARVLPSTEVYSEYRIEGGISGEDVVAANGVTATLNLDKNFVITPRLEVLNYLEDSGKSDSIAASVGLRDTRDPDSKKLLRVETRHSDDETFYGINGTYVQKYNDDTTFLVQNEMRLNQYEDDREDNLQNTLTLAAAHRPKLNDKYNAIYAYKWESNDSNNTNTHILSTHQNYQINESWNVSGRIGAKKDLLNQNGVTHESDAVMIDARTRYDVTQRLSLDLHGGILGTNGFSEKNYSVGAGVNFNVIDNVQIGAGYNFAGFVDKDLDPDGFNAKGMYLGLQLKADESLFDWLGGGEQQHALINAQCQPNNRVEITDASLREKQRRQIEACHFERQQLQQSQATNTRYGQ